MQSSQENVSIDFLKEDYDKSKKNVEIGVKVRLILGDPNLVSSGNQDAFRKSCLKFYSIATKYLKEHLPLNVPVICHAQFLHTEKRNNFGATNAISNVSLTLTAALKNKFSDVLIITNLSIYCRPSGWLYRLVWENNFNLEPRFFNLVKLGTAAHITSSTFP